MKSYSHIKSLIIITTICLLFVWRAFGQSPKTVLFICEHGAGRSPIAAAYFNKMSMEKGLNYVAMFRGTQPDSVLGKTAREGLTRDQHNIASWKPKELSNEDLTEADVVVTMDCILPSDYKSPARIISWQNIPMNEGYALAGAEIKKRVEQLIQQLIKE